MKIFAVFTGGTIGSRQGANGRIAPQKGMAYRLLEWYRSSGGQAEFLTEEPYYILSENLGAEQLCLLIQCVAKQLASGEADGILIMHGTDTLQYSAAVLSYVFGNARIPIVLVSSDFPLEDSRANGYINFRYAVQFIEGAYGKGVFVSYCNPGDIPKIHRGTRLLMHQAYSSVVESVEGIYYGAFHQGKYVPNPDYLPGDTLPALFAAGQDVALKPDAGEILRILPSVGMRYPKPDSGIRAVLHESFHSGTIAVNQGLREFAARAHEMGIPVFLTGLSNKEAEYETVDAYRELGIRPLQESAAISQYCKLWLLISNGMDLEKYMAFSVAEDHVVSSY